MKNLVFIVVFTLSAVGAWAQKVYFIYLQSDTYNPFYVKMNDKIYSSNTSGYLILSNLVDSTYKFSLGFPSAQSESRFIISLGGKDRGFLIKNLETGLGLFDLQNLTITRAQKDESAGGVSYLRRNDDFSSLLSKAANDTSLLYAVVRVQEDVTVKTEEPKLEEKKNQEPATPKDTIAAAITSAVVIETKKQDTVSLAQSNGETKNPDTKKEEATINTDAKEGVQKETGTVIAAESKETVVNTNKETVAKGTSILAGGAVVLATDTLARLAADTSQLVFKKSHIIKHSESSTSEGFGLIFYDDYGGSQDTIRVLIPNPQIVFNTTETDTTAQKTFIHVDELKNEPVQPAPIVVAVKSNTLAKSQCKATASNNDFFKLRKNMASKNTDDDMVSEAKKFFKSKCFTTEQVRNLGALFLTSAGKYQFFDAAYSHVTDQENFASLESEIKDDYFLKRFKALIGE